MPRYSKSKWILSVVLAGLAIWLGTSQLQTQAEEPSAPGAINDPLVTKSYVDEKIAQITGTIPTPSTAPSTQTPTASNLTVVQLKNGQTLYAGAGSELIVRSGKTVAVSSDENGIPDITIGKDLIAGTAIELNHLLIFPREGRGIKPDPKNTAEIFVMVRGTYMVMNADGTKAAQ
jgi:hypothetical protein